MRIKLHPLVQKSLFLTFPSLLWAGNFLLARYYREEFYPYDLAFFRWTLVLVAILPFHSRKLWHYAALLWKYKGLYFLLALTGITGFNTFLYYGLEETTALNAAFINSTIPLLMVLLGWLFFQVKPQIMEWLALVLSIIGVFIILTRGEWTVLQQFKFNNGDIFILCAAASWAVYSICLPQLLRKMTPQAFFCSIVLLGWLILLPYFFYRLVVTLYWSSADFIEVIHPVSLAGAFFIGYVALFASILAYGLWNKCLEVAGANLSGISLNLIPVFTSLGAILFLGEEFQNYHFWGGMSIVGGLLLAIYSKQKKTVSTRSLPIANDS